jgi:hypothetical protein
VIYQFYLTSEIEILMIAPIPSRTVFGVKLLQCSRATMIPATAIGGFLIALGAARDASPGYYPLVVLLIVAAMTLATAMVMILVILLARLLPAQKIRSWMPVLIALVMFVLLLGQQPATAWLIGQPGVIMFLTSALLNLVNLGLVVTGLGTLAIGAGLVAFQMFRTSFHEGWDRFHEVPTRQPRASRVAHRSRVTSGLLRLLPAPLRYFLVKEWLEFRRNPRGLLNLVQPLIIVVTLVIAPVLIYRGGDKILQPLLFLFMLMCASIFLGLMPVGTSLMAVAQEGKKIALLRSVPVSMSPVLKGKFWATWVPVAMSWVLVLVAAGLWLRFPLWQIGFLMGITLWGSAGASLATIAIAGLKVDFTVEELKRRVPIVTSYLIMGLNIFFVVLTVVSAVWLMIRLYPVSPFAAGIKVLAGSGTDGWIFSSPLLSPMLVGLQVVFWVGVKLLWDAAVRRLEGWEAC